MKEPPPRCLLVGNGSLSAGGPVAVALGIAYREILPTAEAKGLSWLPGDLVLVGGLVRVLLGFLALANSDTDSQLLTVASTMTQDILPDLGIEEGDPAWIDRLAVVIGGAVGVVIAATRPDVVSLLGGFGALFAILGVAVVATRYWDASTHLEAFAGMAVGISSPWWS